MSKKGMLFVTNLHYQRHGNGGQQRTYFLIKELAHHFDLIVLSPYGGKNEVVSSIDAIFIKNKGVQAQKMLQTSILGRILLKIVNSIVNITNGSNNVVRDIASYRLRHQIKKIKAQKHNHHFQTIVFDTINTVEKFDRILFQRRILNAHNFDFEISEYGLLQKLKDATSSQTDIQVKLSELLFAKNFEFDIDTFFDIIWTCSESDIEKFKTYNPETKVTFECLPNGSDTETRQMQALTNDYKKLLFVGSLNYFPNINGLRWFVDSIFKKLPSDFQLTIVGKSPSKEDFQFMESYDNIHLIGEVEDVEPYYASHDAVIVPILEGSGTRLKIMEAFSYGKLVLSTSKGIEGILATDGEQYIEFENFKDFETKYALNLDIDKFESIRKQSRILVENRYSWKSIVSDYSKKLYGA